MQPTNRPNTYARMIALMSETSRMMCEKDICDALKLSQPVVNQAIRKALADRKIYIFRWRKESTQNFVRYFRLGSRASAPRPLVMTDAERQAARRERDKAAREALQNTRKWHAERDEKRRVAREMRESAKVAAQEREIEIADAARRVAAQKACVETVRRVRAIVARQPGNPFASLMAQV